MPDITMISAALGSVKAATDIVKLIRDANQSLQNAEMNMKLADLIGALADLKMQLADIQQLGLEKDERIRELEALLKKQANLVYESPAYWSLDDSGTKDGPFCQSCQDKTNKLVRLQDSSGGYTCKVCDKFFSDPSKNQNSIGSVSIRRR